MSDAAVPHLAHIVEAVSAGRCILFLGAAVHAPPPADSAFVYADASRPPIGSALSRALAADCPSALVGEALSNLQRTALLYEISHSRRDLVNRIRMAVHTGKQPSPAVRALAGLPFSLIVTTNYDQLLERALRAAGKDPYVSVYKPNDGALEPTDDYRDGEPTADRPFLFKIHGDIDRPESIVVTDEDYIQFVLRMGDSRPYYPVPETVLYYFRKWPTLFVGYSLVDYNLRLLFKTLRWKIDRAQMPITYSVDRAPDPLILRVWQDERRYVNFVVTDVWSFVPELYRRVTGNEMPRRRA